MSTTNDKPILLCYDDSPEAARAIEAAAGLFGERRAVVVNVLPWMTPAESFAATSSVVPGNAFEELNTAVARRTAHDGAEIARSHGFHAEARGELSHSTWDGIIDAADEIDAAVIVIGSRGLTGLKKVVETSVSQHLAKHARRPVLIVPPASR
jgi:nucleotide-binding universal stress UspA family protein